jgi:CheY-like chemotaxis protein
LSSHPQANPLPVVVLTGSDEVEVAQYVYALGARSFLTKPLRIKDFEKIMRDLRGWLEGDPSGIPQCAEAQASSGDPGSCHRELPQPLQPPRDFIPGAVLNNSTQQRRRDIGFSRQASVCPAEECVSD